MSGGSTVVTASDWTKGISLSVLASIVGGASKLAIRKSWLLERELEIVLRGEPQDGEAAAVDENGGAANDGAGSIIVSAVSTLSQEDDDDNHGSDDAPVDAAVEGSVEMTGETFSRPDEVVLRGRRSAAGDAAAAATPSRAAILPSLSSSSSTSSLRQRLSLLVSRGGSSHPSLESDVPVDATFLSSPYVRAPSSDPAEPRRRRSSLDAASATQGGRRPSGGGGGGSSEGRQSSLSAVAAARFATRIDTTTNNNSGRHHADIASLEGGGNVHCSGSESTPRRRSSSRARHCRGGSVASMSSVQRGCCQSKFWICALRGSGMVGMTFLNPLCGVLAMNFASPSILAPFSGLTLVWIILFSEALIGERPTPTQVMAALMIVLGEVVVALYGDHTNDSGISVQEVRASYQEPLFLVYFVVMAMWMALLAYWMRGGSATLRRFAWGVSGGSLTGLQNFLKDALTVTKSVHVPAQQEAEHATYSSREQSSHVLLVAMFVTMAVVAAFGGLVLLTACMKRYDVTYSAAMFVGSFVLSASIMSAIHYDTFAHLHSVSSYIMYPTGLVILIGGVYMLVQESKECNDAEFEELVAVDSSPASPSSIVSSSSHGHGMIALDSNLARNRSNESGRVSGYFT